MPELSASPGLPAASSRNIPGQSTLADVEQVLTGVRSERTSIYTRTNRYANREQQPRELISERTRSHRIPQNPTQHGYVVPPRSMSPVELPSNDTPVLDRPMQQHRGNNISRTAINSSAWDGTAQTNGSQHPVGSHGTTRTGRVQVTKGRTKRNDPTSQSASDPTYESATGPIGDHPASRLSTRPASSADVLRQSAYSRTRQGHSELEALGRSNTNTRSGITAPSNIAISSNQRAASDSNAPTLNNIDRTRAAPNHGQRQTSWQGPSHPSYAAIQRQQISMEHPFSSLSLPSTLERPPLTPSPGLSSTETAPSVQTVSLLAEGSDRENTPPRERRRWFSLRPMSSVVFGEEDQSEVSSASTFGRRRLR
ncbi:hypothetical protein IG631_10955 [Alternaria alternata]|nr:hypothetical protein IG631_10955 [Alternaria alternata]